MSEEQDKKQRPKVVAITLDDALEAFSVLNGMKAYRTLCDTHREQFLKGLPKDMIDFVDTAMKALSELSDDEAFIFFAENIAERRLHRETLKEQMKLAEAAFKESIAKFKRENQDQSPKH